ncbi:MAG: biotin--[acetyl-CoA-carboxylase] ligase [Rhodovarius sp.]|nr:biotin--[acetyl-CoA-carboxylase] ligase [Rhodovarius sp.]
MRVRLSVYASLPSTATLLRAAAAAGAPAGTAILALRQTAGRGTHGRSWASPPGNLHLSVLLRPPLPLRAVPQIGLMAGVALREAAGARTRLKWPNDLMLEGAKAGGILVEAEGDAAGGIAWVGLGFGVNLAHAPSLPDRPTAALGAEPPEDFAARLLSALARWQAVLVGQGFAPIRSAWEEAGPPRGAPLSVARGASRISGRYEGLSEEGGLRLATDAGSLTLHAGEVF